MGVTISDYREVVSRLKTQLTAQGYSVGQTVLYPVKVFRGSDNVPLAALCHERGEWRAIYTFDLLFQPGEKAQLETDLVEILGGNYDR